MKRSNISVNIEFSTEENGDKLNIHILYYTSINNWFNNYKKTNLLLIKEENQVIKDFKLNIYWD